MGGVKTEEDKPLRCSETTAGITETALIAIFIYDSEKTFSFSQELLLLADL